jgi:hypothetical protein
LAKASYEGRMALGPDLITPAASAAAAIRAAILADSGPRRWTCDPLGGQLLEAWRTDPDAMFGGR